MSFLYMEFSWEKDNQYLVERRRSTSSMIDETRSRRGGMDTRMMSRNDEKFRPIEHPMEPLDGDQPVECPLPNSSTLINDGRMHKEPVTHRIWKKATEQISNKQPRMVVASSSSSSSSSSVAAVAEAPPVRAFRKRHHHTLGRSVDNAITPLFPSPALYNNHSARNVGVSDMLPHFNKFES